MAPFLPVRAISRSQAVRVGRQTLKTGRTTYVDLGSQVESGGVKAGSPLPYSPFKELQNHLAIGAVIVVGALTNTANPWVLEGTGGVASATKAAEPEVAVTAGELYNRDTGQYVAFPELAAAKKKFTEEAGKSRIDIISVEEVGAKAPVYTEGVAAATGSEVAPATPEKSVLLATVAFLGKEGEPVKKEANVTQDVVRP